MSIDWKAEYLKSVESGCITLDELREARAELAAIKQALAAPTVQEPVLKDNSNYRYDPPVAEPVGLIDRLTNPEQHYEFTDPKKANAVLMSLCQEAADALAAPVQEPVAWMYPDDYKRMLTSETFCTVYSVEVGSATRGESTIALYTTPPAAAVQKRPPNCGTSYCSCIECIMPPARPAPVKVWEAEGYDALMQEMQMVKARNIRQHAEIERLKAAQPAVPDAMTSADIQEHIEYVAGWNDCRQAMLEMMK
jgi:hypothetical protein